MSLGLCLLCLLLLPVICSCHKKKKKMIEVNLLYSVVVGNTIAITVPYQTQFQDELVTVLDTTIRSCNNTSSKNNKRNKTKKKGEKVEVEEKRRLF